MAPPSQFRSTQWHPRHFLPLRRPLRVQQTLTSLTASPALTARPVQTVRGPRSMERGWRTPRAQWRWSLVGGLIDILALLAWLPGPQFPSTPAPVKCSKHAGTKSVKLRPHIEFTEGIHWGNRHKPCRLMQQTHSYVWNHVVKVRNALILCYIWKCPDILTLYYTPFSSLPASCTPCTHVRQRSEVYMCLNVCVTHIDL